MNLYACYDPDDPSSTFRRDFDEFEWRAIWANTPEEAEACYRSLCSERPTDPVTGETIPYPGEVSLTLTSPGVEPQKAGVHEERRPEVLRLIGWRVGDERECETCGLAAMDMKEHCVCDNCYLCRGCRPFHTEDRCPVCQEEVKP